MHKTLFKNVLFFVFFLNFFPLFSQELPPIVKYNSNVYGAGNQNWMISQDNSNYIFFANNEGLLEFNGSNWKLYKSPNETIIRSVKVIGNKVFTGCYMEFGYWVRSVNGDLKYTSISQTIKKSIQDDEQFWNIINYEQWVIFQSLNRIYIYDTKSNKVSIVKPKQGILKSFSTTNAIYFQTQNDGLYEIENGKMKLVSNDLIFKNNKIVSIFSLDDGLLFQTQFNGFFKFSNGQVAKYSMIDDKELETNAVYCSKMLSDGSIAIGTVSKGVYVLSSAGAIKYHITQNTGLSNNTALSLFEDLDKNLWIGLDNGINCINLQSPVKSFVDDTGILGTVYASEIYNGKLYIGTNQGLFYKQYNSNSSFQFVAGTKGQVWSLFQYQGTLFCGHDSGTFIVNDGQAQNIFAQSGTWKFNPISKNPNVLLQGNYYGISVLEKKNNHWSFRNKIKGFDYSSKYFEINAKNMFFVSHEYKGIFRFQVDYNFQKASKVFTYTSPLKGKNASLVKFNDAIYYAYKQGVYKLNNSNFQFEKDKEISKIFDKGEYTTGRMIVDKSNKIWFFTKNYIHYFTLNKLNYQLKHNDIPIPSSLTNSMLGYENITNISNYNYLIGTTDGYYTINLSDLSFKNYNVSLTNIAVNKVNQALLDIAINQKGKLKYDDNNITFSYTVPEYNKYINSEYQYKLEGFQDEWSEWSSKSNVNFKNLPPGEYVFKVRAKTANATPDKIASYTFIIKKPWYATNLAVILYLILLGIAAYLINKSYKNYYQKQKEKLIEENNLLLEIKELENEQQMMKLINHQLSQDVNEKNKELAVSTMSLLKKNELLSVIKEDLKKTSEDGSKNIKSVIHTINKNIVEEDTWNVFKEAFDNADKDFLKKMKAAHASLTPNDLRLCAYLRLNLSSKEIAPLLNISVRSVEIKRYRLRKKMDLPHEQGLVEYILSI